MFRFWLMVSFGFIGNMARWRLASTNALYKCLLARSESSHRSIRQVLLHGDLEDCRIHSQLNHRSWRFRRSIRQFQKSFQQDKIVRKIIINYTLKKEDFQFMTYNFKFLSEVPDSLISSNLKSVEDATAKNYRVIIHLPCLMHFAYNYAYFTIFIYFTTQNIKSQLNETSDAADKNKYSLQVSHCSLVVISRVKYKQLRKCVLFSSSKRPLFCKGSSLFVASSSF